MSLKVRPGDVVFSRGTGVGKLIRWAETEPGEAPTFANHVALVVKGGWLVPPDPAERRGLAETVEALGRVEHTRWWVRHKHERGAEIEVYGHSAVTQEEVIHVVRFAMNHVGQKYGWWKLGAHLLDRLLFRGEKTLSRLLFVDDRPICSYLVARAFEVAGVHFGQAAVTATPDSMHDWCSVHKQWRFIGREKLVWGG